jgi:hypothetical protein
VSGKFTDLVYLNIFARVGCTYDNPGSEQCVMQRIVYGCVCFQRNDSFNHQFTINVIDGYRYPPPQLRTFSIEVIH